MARYWIYRRIALAMMTTRRPRPRRLNGHDLTTPTRLPRIGVRRLGRNAPHRTKDTFPRFSLYNELLMSRPLMMPIFFHSCIPIYFRCSSLLARSLARLLLTALPRLPS